MPCSSSWSSRSGGSSVGVRRPSLSRRRSWLPGRGSSAPATRAARRQRCRTNGVRGRGRLQVHLVRCGYRVGWDPSLASTPGSAAGTQHWGAAASLRSLSAQCGARWAPNRIRRWQLHYRLSVVEPRVPDKAQPTNEREVRGVTTESYVETLHTYPLPVEHPLNERFMTSSGVLERVLKRRDGRSSRSTVGRSAWMDGPVSADHAEQLWLRSSRRPEAAGTASPVRVVDLFSGCGGLTLGLEEAARAVGRGIEPTLAVDFDADAIGVYKQNYPRVRAENTDVREIFDGNLGMRLTESEQTLARRHAGTDILVGGPPCQGHSDFNNHTRRNDRKNELYFTMVRAAEVLRPASIMIENVPGALHDKGRVVQRTADKLAQLGYMVTTGVIDMSQMGVAQQRKRLVLLANSEREPSIERILANHARGPRGIEWAIRDLEDAALSENSNLMDQTAASAPATRQRIDYLFDHDLYELPDSERPACHSGGGHSYSSIYGRLRWEKCAQTITTGFYSMCMGRYVHPSRRRTLTAREAARLQYIPDWFDFTAARGRTSLARMIGNAVPSRLSYAVAVEWLR